MNGRKKRQLMASLPFEIQICEERQPNGQWLKSIKFKLPIIEEDMSLSLDNDTQVETVCLLERGVVTGGTRIGGYLFSHGTREQDDIIELPVMEKAHMLGESV